MSRHICNVEVVMIAASIVGVHPRIKGRGRARDFMQARLSMALSAVTYEIATSSIRST